MIRLPSLRYPLPFVLLGALSFLYAVSGNQPIVTIDGGWSPWSSVSTPCLRTVEGGTQIVVSCGGGKWKKYRSCTNPRKQGLRAKDCEGASEKEFDCNMHPCDMQWSTWSNCSATCGRGMRERWTMCSETEGGALKRCRELGLSEQDYEHVQECNTWDKDNCPSPCEGYSCMEFGACVDESDDEDPKVDCVCQLGRVMNEERTECIIPPLTTPTPRPIPTLKPAVKTATTVVTRTASTLLIIFTGITLFLFATLRIYDPARVIQMNMEIAIISAHICLIIPPLHEYPDVCRFISILIHFFHVATFMFMFLESLHTYSLVAFVVKKNGMLTRLQNILLGWGIALAITLVVVALQYKNYGGEYHCWLNMGENGLVYGQFIPIIVLVILIFTMIEAAGAAEYRRLPGMDNQQLTSAKIMQRTNLIIMPLVFASFLVGTMSEYEQNVGLYSTFTLVNGILGGCIFFFHSTGNEQVRAKLSKAYNSIFKKT